jgi:hypothetical protein
VARQEPGDLESCQFSVIAAVPILTLALSLRASDLSLPINMRHIDDLPDEILSQLFTVGSQFDLNYHENDWIAAAPEFLVSCLPDHTAASFLPSSRSRGLKLKPFAHLCRRVCHRWADIAAAKSNRHLYLARTWFGQEWVGLEHANGSNSYELSDIAVAFTQFVSDLRESDGADLWITFEDYHVDDDCVEVQLLFRAVALLLQSYRSGLAAVDFITSRRRLGHFANHLSNSSGLFPRLEWVGFEENLWVHKDTEPKPLPTEHFIHVSRLYDVDVDQGVLHGSKPPQTIIAARPPNHAGSLSSFVGPNLQVLCFTALPQFIAMESLLESLATCCGLKILSITRLENQYSPQEDTESLILEMPALDQLHAGGDAESIHSLLSHLLLPKLRILSLKANGSLGTLGVADYKPTTTSFYLPALARVIRRGSEDSDIFFCIIAPALRRLDLIHEDYDTDTFELVKTWIQPPVISLEHILISNPSLHYALRRLVGIQHASLKTLTIAIAYESSESEDAVQTAHLVLPSLELIEFRACPLALVEKLVESITAPSLRRITVHSSTHGAVPPYLIIHTPLGEGTRLFEQCRRLEIDQEKFPENLLDRFPRVQHCVVHQPTIPHLRTFRDRPSLLELILDLTEMNCTGEMEDEIAQSMATVHEHRLDAGYPPLSVILRDSFGDRMLS